MKYLISKFHCVVYGEEKYELFPNVKYTVERCDNEPILVVGFNSEIPFAINLNDECIKQQVTKVCRGRDTYYFLNAQYCMPTSISNFKYANQQINVSVSTELIINVDGETILSKKVTNITYSHYEVIGDNCIIYFEGIRKFVCIIKEKQVLFSNYYDEINVDGEDRYFMHRCCDSLDHGIVCAIQDKKVDNYPIYLDDNELNMKEKFTCSVFLDCVRAGNLKYCKSLLDDDLSIQDEKKIKDFFPIFDDFYLLNENEAVLFEKDTLAGICEFEVKNSKIINIINS